MAAGIYKSGVQIKLVYQAAGLLAAAAPVGSVFDEAGALDSAATSSLTTALAVGELTGVAAGRYHGFFTPDAEGRWTVVIQDKNGDGEVSKVYQVCGHDMDSVGDAIGAVPALVSDIESALDLISPLISDVESAVNVVITALATIDTADVASQLLLTKSALVSSFLEDFAPLISDVESAVDLIASPAIVS